MATKPNYFRAIGVALLLWRAWEYFKTQGRLLDQWNWAVKSVRLITLGKTIELELLLDITNNSNLNAQMTAIDLDVFVNGKNIGRAQSSDLFYFGPYATTPMRLRFRTTRPDLVFVAKQLFTRGMQIPVALKGSVKAETVAGIFVPIAVDYKTAINEILF
jgi:hypothetical protein